MSSFNNIFGTGGDDSLNGTGGQDWFQTVGGDDTLSGFASADAFWVGPGFSVMTGGKGNDHYVVWNNGDTIIELADPVGGPFTEGTDRISSYIDIDLSDPAYNNVEVLRLVGEAAVFGLGNSLDNSLEGNTLVNTLAGGSGDDIYIIRDLAAVNDVIVEFGGIFGGMDTIETYVSYSIASLPDVENITLAGTGSINAIGNSGDNIFTGNSGRNHMTGGDGDDTYAVGAGDIITEVNGLAGGNDTVVAGVTYSIKTQLSLENITLQTHAGNINATGNTGVNFLIGNEGSNTLDGGGGADTMAGLEGNDTYIVDNANDKILNFLSLVPLPPTVPPSGPVDHYDDGTDLILASVSYDMSAQAFKVENITLTGTAALSAIGNDENNKMTGNTGVNTLAGGVGNDTLDGGKGVDTMDGGDGDDTMFADSSADVSIGGNGTDLVNASTSYTIFDTTVEKLTLTGTAKSGTGNAIDNVITGNASANILHGEDGNDTVDGQAGNDTLFGDGGIDTVIGGAGNDIIHGGDGNDGSLVGGAGNDTVFGDDGDDYIQGDAGNDVLFGGNGNDIMDGLGFAGNDTMVGGLGDDVYGVDTVKDIVIEYANEGTDTVITTVSWTLAANFENLTIRSGSGLIGTGNSVNNVISDAGGGNLLQGLGGDDTLVAGGGADTLDGGVGNDTMTGSPGDDIFIVDSALDICNGGGGLHNLILSSVTYNMATQAASVQGITLLGVSNLDAIGNALDNVMTGNAGTNTLSGGLGNDTYFVQNATDVVIDVASGADTLDSVMSSVTWTLSSFVENLTLTGSAAINGTGNTLDNVITGNSAINTLTGLTGNDTYIVDNTVDIIVEAAGEGTDEIRSSVTYTLPVAGTSEVEDLRLTGTAHINGTGNTLANFLTGNSGNNTLDGGTGIDTYAGGAGNDVYIVDNALDLVTETLRNGDPYGDGGTDTVMASVTYDMSLHATMVENLTLTGVAAINGTGNTLANVITGNTATNVLTGLGGNDTLDGGGGADTLIGGLGDDQYVVDNAADIVTEVAMEGKDTIMSGVTYDMSVSATGEVESLTLTGTAVINGTGNDIDNILTGNVAINTLAGGLGNDTYIMDNTQDIIVEASGALTGTDLVKASLTYSLAAIANVENLMLTGTGNFNATGNTLDNFLIGNTGNNTLDGLTGADTYAGSVGNDVYMVDNPLDSVVEILPDGTPLSDPGTDTVMASVSYSMAARAVDVDNLTLTGAANIDGTGNGLDNVITGNSGINTLAGGDGNDTYYVTAGDVVVEVAAQGTADTVYAGVDWILSSEVENLVLTGTANINGTGNASDNTITGNSGVNILTGGAGNDTYIIDTTDTIGVDTGGTKDIVEIAASYSIATRPDLDGITLLGTKINHFNATGNDGVNILTGNAGNNILDGGLGADTMYGGLGNDVYHVDDIGDACDEITIPGGGTDLVISTVSYGLSLTLENLTLIGPNALNGFGNPNVNIITGNIYDNYLNGDAGADTMIGGAGNDTYGVDNALDVIKESSGVDWVYSGLFTYKLPTGLENLALTYNGTVGETGIGNTGNNTIIGGDGKDILDGGGGVDSMDGGKGDDTFFVDSSTDVVLDSGPPPDPLLFETGDLIMSKVTWTLTDASNVENLTLTGGSALNGTGNNLNNYITGNTGTNILHGGGGNDTLYGNGGHDTLFGDAGQDVFVIKAETAYKAITTIADYTPGEDSLLLDVLQNVDPLFDVITEFVKSTISGANTLIWVDADGIRGTHDHWKEVAILLNVHVDLNS